MTTAPSDTATDTTRLPNPRGTIAITHTRADGTMAVGGAKGDGSGDILKQHPQRFRWSPSLRCWIIRNSRDKQADHRKIECAAIALREAGFEVSISIDEETRRTFAEAEADRYERAEARAERRQDYADAAADRSASLYAAGREKLSRIPFGQPILVDHYSANRDRNYRARASAQIDRSFAEADKHAHHANLATAAAAYRGHRENVPRTLRRIEKLEAEERQLLRLLEPRQHESGNADTSEWDTELKRRLDETREQLEYWRDHVKAAEASGVKVWRKEDFAKGDFVRYGGRWYEVLRVNAKSVTVPTGFSGWSEPVVRANDPKFPRTATAAYHEVRGRLTADELAIKLAAGANDNE